MIKGIEGRIEVVELDNRNNKVILKAGDEFVYSGRLFHKLVPPIDTGATSLPVPEITKRKPETPPIENLRVYRAKSLVDFLERQSKGKIKLARKTKYEEKANVKNDLSKDTEYILQKLLDQTGLKSRPGLKLKHEKNYGEEKKEFFIKASVFEPSPERAKPYTSQPHRSP